MNTPMLSPEQFAVFPWGWQPPHGWTPPDPAVLADVRACGFNLAGFISPDDLDVVSAAGMQGIVLDHATHVGNAEAQLDEAEITRRVTELTKRVGNHPAVFGYHLRDEPGADIFPGLGRWAAAYQQASPQHLPYINLFPNYATPDQLKSANYEEHLEAFVTTVHPRFISYDHYALLDDGSVRKSYFPNLEIVRATARRHNLPFWNIVLSNAHFNYAEPTPAGLRFQLYTTLAYGARGISYFTYFTPHTGNYRLGPIDQFGHKTPTWAMLRDVNWQLHRLGPTYVTLTNLNVIHHPNVPAGCAGLSTSRWLSELTGGDLLVGEFADAQGQPFVLVVNKSLQRSTWFGLKFKQPGKICMINAYTGASESWQGEHNWLAPGQGQLLYLKN